MRGLEGSMVLLKNFRWVEFEMVIWFYFMNHDRSQKLGVLRFVSIRDKAVSS